MDNTLKQRVKVKSIYCWYSKCGICWLTTSHIRCYVDQTGMSACTFVFWYKNRAVLSFSDVSPPPSRGGVLGGIRFRGCTVPLYVFRPGPAAFSAASDSLLRMFFTSRAGDARGTRNSGFFCGQYWGGLSHKRVVEWQALKQPVWR